MFRYKLRYRYTHYTIYYSTYIYSGGDAVYANELEIKADHDYQTLEELLEKQNQT